MLSDATAFAEMNAATARASATPYRGDDFRGRGIVIPAGGVKYFPSAWVSINVLRKLGCKLPIELWHRGRGEIDAEMRSLVEPLGVRCVDAYAMREQVPARTMGGWELKCYSILHSRFREVLLLDADNVAAEDPSRLFDDPHYRATGSVFWPDINRFASHRDLQKLAGVSIQDEPEFESGQILVDKQRCWAPLQLAMWLNEHSDYWYQLFYGDKETFHVAWRKLGVGYAMPPKGPRLLPFTLLQLDFEGRPLFQHRVGDKWICDGRNAPIRGFKHQAICSKAQDELRKRWVGRPNRPFDGAIADEPVRNAAVGLCKQSWKLKEDGQRSRNLRFRMNGSVTTGRSKSEQAWSLGTNQHQFILSLLGERGVTALLVGLEDDKKVNSGWIGRRRADSNVKLRLETV